MLPASPGAFNFQKLLRDQCTSFQYSRLSK